MRSLAVVVTLLAARTAAAAAPQSAPYDAPPLPPPGTVQPAPATPAPPPPPRVQQRVDQQPPPFLGPTESQNRPRPSESGLAAGQIAASSAVVFVGELAMVAAVSHGGVSQLGVPALALGPLLGGLVVCGIGSASTAYQGRCGPAIGGAYIGALLFVPAAFIGCSLDHGSGGDYGDACLVGAILGGVVGYVIGTSVGATVGWHLGKRPRGERPSALAAPPTFPVASANDAWPELRGRPAASGPQGTRVSLSLLSLSF
jgi:hypothetical protein